MNSTKKDERALLASCIVRRALQSEQPTLVALLYKLDPEEFNSEDGVDKLVKAAAAGCREQDRRLLPALAQEAQRGHPCLSRQGGPGPR